LHDIPVIEASKFVEPARELGFGFWTGVPCSYLKPFINYIIDADGLTYVSSANEGDALATATGAALAGRRAVVMMQNSGLGNAVSPLTSLNWVFRIPVLMIVTLRGEPEQGDEPQHELMGQITTGLLEQMQIPWAWFPDESDQIEACLETAGYAMDRSGLPYALVMRKGSVRPNPLQTDPLAFSVVRNAQLVNETTGQGGPGRHEALQEIIHCCPEHNSVVLGTTGYTGRELFSIADRCNQFYVVGSMGCASSLGLGLSMARPDLRVVVADGDGAALMRMGNLSTIGAYAGERFYHVVLDNGMHESTGGQATISATMSFAGVANACGFAHTVESDTKASIASFLSRESGPQLLHLKTRPGVPGGLPRPGLMPSQVKQRLMKHLSADAAWRDILR
jgi:phosphonopyruvate decarboxylase